MRRALPIALAVCLGLLAGRLSAPGKSSSPAPHPDSPGPTRHLSGGVGVGYAHSRAGAIAANAHYQQLFADTAVLRRGELRRRIEAVATPSFAPRLLSVNQPGTDRLARGTLGMGLRGGVPTLFCAVPVFYEVVSYSPQRAVIDSWGFTIVGNGSIAEPSAYFGGSRMALVWRQGDWKISHTEGYFGPTPKLATPRNRGEGFRLIELIDGMRPYDVDP